jgi:hypothetical protein
VDAHTRARGRNAVTVLDAHRVSPYTVVLMMLNMTLLGTPQITWNGEPLVLRPRNSARAKAILYYLAAEGRPVTRERMAGLLWSDWPEKKARDYLRGELFLLGPLRPSPLREVDGCLELDPATAASDLASFRHLSERPA